MRMKRGRSDERERVFILSYKRIRGIEEGVTQGGTQDELKITLGGTR